MDLSHWDLISLLTRREAGLLAVGSDPAMSFRSPELEAKASVVQRVITEAFEAAWFLAWEKVRGIYDPPAVIVDDIWEPHQLPSIELRRYYSEAIRDPANRCLPCRDDRDTEEHHFNQDDLAALFEAIGFRSVYSFTGEGNDRLPDVVNHSSGNQNREREPQEHARTETKIAKPLRTRERNTLLVIIAALARLADLDISKPSKTAGVIAKSSEELGSPLPARTIEEHLRSVAQALEARAR